MMSLELTNHNTAFRQTPSVGGWLLMLCLILVFVTPATVIYSVGKVTATLGLAHNVRQIVLPGVYCATFIGVAICSAWTGVRLWLVKPNADKSARIYLLGYLAAHLFYFVFWLFVYRPGETLILARMGYYHVVTPIGSTALWYFYLENSRRVRETFSSV